METHVKLSEETGELAEAILVTSDAFACTYKKGITKEDVLKEVADVVIVASSIAYKAGFSVEDLEKAVDEKLAKWQSKVDETK